MAVPRDIKKSISDVIWEEADTLDWTHLSIHEKSVQYKIWAKDERIGQVLSRYMPIERVHPYIKDSLLKPYAKSKKLGKDEVIELLNLADSSIIEEYVKPLGFRLEDGRVICWGRALDWKIVLLATFERAHSKSSYIPHCVILTGSHGRFATIKFQRMAIEASQLLGIESLRFKK